MPKTKSPAPAATGTGRTKSNGQTDSWYPVGEDQDCTRFFFGRVPLWIWRRRDLGLSEKAVLFAMAARAFRSGWCSASVDTIARDCGIHSATVRRILPDPGQAEGKALCRLLRCEVDKAASNRSRRRYRLLWLAENGDMRTDFVDSALAGCEAGGCQNLTPETVSMDRKLRSLTLQTAIPALANCEGSTSQTATQRESKERNSRERIESAPAACTEENGLKVPTDDLVVAASPRSDDVLLAPRDLPGASAVSALEALRARLRHDRDNPLPREIPARRIRMPQATGDATDRRRPWRRRAPESTPVGQVLRQTV